LPNLAVLKGLIFRPEGRDTTTLPQRPAVTWAPSDVSQTGFAGVTVTLDGEPTVETAGTATVTVTAKADTHALLDGQATVTALGWGAPVAHLTGNTGPVRVAEPYGTIHVRIAGTATVRPTTRSTWTYDDDDVLLALDLL
jgi:hypothetical protein